MSEIETKPVPQEGQLKMRPNRKQRRMMLNLPDIRNTKKHRDARTALGCKNMKKDNI